MNQTLDEKIRKLVIMGCHPECKTYEEALEKELCLNCVVEHRGHKKLYAEIVYCWQDDCKNKKFKIIGLPITIGRILNVLSNKDVLILFNIDGNYFLINNIKWQLTKENGMEATDDDQTDETINKLLELLSNRNNYASS